MENVCPPTALVQWIDLLWLLMFLPDPFRGMRAWRKTMEPQKPGNCPGPGREIVHRQRIASE